MLLALVIGVWGTVAYKILTALNPEIPEPEQTELVAKVNFKFESEVEAFSISEVNRDPFLGTLLKKEPKTPVVKKAPPVQWKPINYLGSVKQNSTRQHIFIVSINGTQHLMKKGETKDSITLAYGNAKSVTLRYKNKTKSFSLNQ